MVDFNVFELGDVAAHADHVIAPLDGERRRFSIRSQRLSDDFPPRGAPTHRGSIGAVQIGPPNFPICTRAIAMRSLGRLASCLASQCLVAGVVYGEQRAIDVRCAVVDDELAAEYAAGLECAAFEAFPHFLAEMCGQQFRCRAAQGRGDIVDVAQ